MVAALAGMAWRRSVQALSGVASSALSSSSSVPTLGTAAADEACASARIGVAVGGIELLPLGRGFELGDRLRLVVAGTLVAASITAARKRVGQLLDERRDRVGVV